MSKLNIPARDVEAPRARLIKAARSDLYVMDIGTFACLPSHNRIAKKKS